MTTPNVVQQSFAKARALVNESAPDFPERPMYTSLRVTARLNAAKLSEGPGESGGGPLRDAAQAIAEGRTTSVKLVEEAFAVADAKADLNPIAYFARDEALAEARERDAETQAGKSRGPIHGIPVTVKDVIHVAGMPTRAGSAAYDVLPEKDAGGVARLREAGAVILGKATTHEFALGVTTPQARNPHDPTRIPGGSSGGSAISVSQGIGFASLGTDTRASIRIPPALSGVVGFKATFDAVPADGVVTLSWTMDHVAPIASTVADAATVLDTLMDQPGNLSRYIGSSIKGLRIGVADATFDECQPGVKLAVENAINVLEGLGAVIKKVSRPNNADLEMTNSAGLLVSRSEAAAYHGKLGTDLATYWAETRDQITEAAQIPAWEYVAAQRVRSRLADEFLALYDEVDVLAMPTSPVVAPKVEEAEQYLTILSRNCIPWSFVGFPGVSLPTHDRSEGLPVGLQLVAPPHEERLLVALGTAYEQAG